MPIVNGGSIDGIFVGETGDKIIVAIMFFILYTSLMNMFFKQKLLYLQNLKMIIDMTIKIKRNFT